MQYILLRIKILQYWTEILVHKSHLLALNRWYWCNILQYVERNNYCNVLEYCNIYCWSLIYCNIYCQSFRYCNTYCCWQIFPINMQYIFPKVSSISTELVIICVNVVIVILSAWLATLQIERRSILLLVAVLDNAGLRRHRFYHQSVSTSSQRDSVAIFICHLKAGRNAQKSTT